MTPIRLPSTATRRPGLSPPIFVEVTGSLSSFTIGQKPGACGALLYPAGNIMVFPIVRRIRHLARCDINHKLARLN